MNCAIHNVPVVEAGSYGKDVRGLESFYHEFLQSGICSH